MIKAELRTAAYVVIWLALLAGFIVMSVFAIDHDLFAADHWLTVRIQHVENELFVRAIGWAEDLADGPILIAAYLLVALALWLSRRSIELALLVLTALARLINTGAKVAIHRPRPTEDLVIILDEASGYGFPSGHVEGAVLFFGFVFYLATITIRQGTMRRAIQAICVAIVVLTGFERIYTGAHWPSDVLGGALLGGFLLLTLIWLHKRYQDRLTAFGVKRALTKQN